MLSTCNPDVQGRRAREINAAIAEVEAVQVEHIRLTLGLKGTWLVNCLNLLKVTSPFKVLVSDVNLQPPLHRGVRVLRKAVGGLGADEWPFPQSVRYTLYRPTPRLLI